MCWPTVALVHFATSGVAFDQPSTAELNNNQYVFSKDCFNILPNGIALHMPQLFVIAISIQIYPSPAPKERQSPIDRP